LPVAVNTRMIRHWYQVIGTPILTRWLF